MDPLLEQTFIFPGVFRERISSVVELEQVMSRLIKKGDLRSFRSCMLHSEVGFVSLRTLAKEIVAAGLIDSRSIQKEFARELMNFRAAIDFLFEESVIQDNLSMFCYLTGWSEGHYLRVWNEDELGIKSIYGTYRRSNNGLTCATRGVHIDTPKLDIITKFGSRRLLEFVFSEPGFLEAVLGPTKPEENNLGPTDPDTPGLFPDSGSLFYMIVNSMTTFRFFESREIFERLESLGSLVPEKADPQVLDFLLDHGFPLNLDSSLVKTAVLSKSPVFKIPIENIKVLMKFGVLSLSSLRLMAEILIRISSKDIPEITDFLDAVHSALHSLKTILPDDLTVVVSEYL